MPGPGGDQSAVLDVCGERAGDQGAGMLGVAPGRLDRSGDEGRGAGRDAGPGEAACFGGQLERFVPPSGVEVGPAERGRGAAAGRPHRLIVKGVAGGAKQADRVRGLVGEPGGGTRVQQGTLASAEWPGDNSGCAGLTGDGHGPEPRGSRSRRRRLGAARRWWWRRLAGGPDGRTGTRRSRRAERVPGGGRRTCGGCSCQREQDLGGTEVVARRRQRPRGDQLAAEAETGSGDCSSARSARSLAWSACPADTAASAAWMRRRA